MTSLIKYCAAALLVAITFAPSQSFSASAPNAGPDVFGYQRQGVDVDSRAMLFRGGLAAYKAGKFKQAKLVWELTARLGDGASQYMLAHMYRSGKGQTANIRASFQWYIQAASKGVAAAQYRLGEAFFGVGDIPNTLLWWTRSANAGFVPAQCNLGMMHLFGRSGAKRPDLAANWLFRAANFGSARAQFYLGIMFLSGDGVEANVETAKNWLSKSFDNGFIYANAVNVTQDIQEKINALNLVPTAANK